MKTVITCIAVVLVISVALLFLQPSSQEAARENLAAIEKVLEKAQVPEADKLETATKELGNVKASKASQAHLDSAFLAIHEAEISLETDRARLSSISSEIKTQIDEAKKNLDSPTALERAKGIKDQILALLWPALIVVLIIYLLHSQQSINFLEQMARVISTIKVPGGLEIAFASTVVKSKQEEVLGEYRQQVNKQYDALASQYQVGETLDRLVKGPVEKFFQEIGKQPKFRCTIHMRDMLFANSLYQLVDYKGEGKGGRGRAWSIRRGMIGRTWRLEISDAQGKVSENATELIDKWGFKREEAENSKYQTMLCHLIKAENDNPVAMLYLDAEDKYAFGTQDQMNKLLEIIRNEVKNRKLDGDLQKIWQQAQASAPLIEIYADHK